MCIIFHIAAGRVRVYTFLLSQLVGPTTYEIRGYLCKAQNNQSTLSGCNLWDGKNEIKNLLGMFGWLHHLGRAINLVI